MSFQDDLNNRRPMTAPKPRYTFHAVQQAFAKGDLHATFNLIADEYEKQGAEQERADTIARIRSLICFDAKRQGWCEHHGGKCGELLDLVRELEDD